MKNRIFIYVMRGGAIFLLTFILYKLAFFNLLWISSPSDSVFHDLPFWSLRLVAVASMLFAFNSLTNFFTLYHREDRDEALAGGRRETFFGELSTVIRSPAFISETSAVLFLTLIFSVCGGLSEVTDMIFETVDIPDTFRALFPALVLIPSFFLISLFARYEVRRYWFALDRRGELPVLERKLRFFARLGIILLGYPLIFPFVPMLAFVALTFISFFVKLSVVLGVVGVIVGIALVVLIIVVICYISAINKRKKFLKQLHRICEEKGYEISEIKHPYRSFFRHFEGASFTLKRGDELYSCRLIPSVRRGVPLYLSSDRHGFFLHGIGTKNHHISLNHNIIWGHEGEGVKLTVIDPMPKRVIAIAQDGTTRPLLPADKAWDSIIYDAATLIGVIDRDCLGKINKTY